VWAGDQALSSGQLMCGYKLNANVLSSSSSSPRLMEG